MYYAYLITFNHTFTWPLIFDLIIFKIMSLFIILVYYIIYFNILQEITAILITLLQSNYCLKM